jgi:membrane associated rhomboid family serine protease
MQNVTRGALIIAGINLLVSLVWLLSDAGTRDTLQSYLVATPSTVFQQGHVWTVVTGIFFEPQFIQLVMNVLILFLFVPTLERFWGTPRFFRFFAITALAGMLGGLLAGYATGREVPIFGLAPFVLAATVAFGVIYARTPVQFFGVLPLTGRQLMYGFLAVYTLMTVLGGHWELFAAFAAACLAAVILTSKRWSPALAWKKWRIARARRRLSVLEGGAKPRPKKRDEGFLN